MTKIALILETDADLNITDTDPETGDYLLGNDLMVTLNDLLARWTASEMPGAIIAGGRKLIMAKIETESVNPVLQVELLLTAYGLNWDLLATGSFKSVVLVPGDYSDPDNPVEPVTGQYKYMDPDMLRIANFFAPRYASHDMDGNPIGDPLPFEMAWCNKYKGQVRWVE